MRNSPTLTRTTCNAFIAIARVLPSAISATVIYGTSGRFSRRQSKLLAAAKRILKRIRIIRRKFHAAKRAIPSLHHPARRMTDLESLLASLTEARRRFAEPDPALHEKLANAYEDYLRRLHSDRARLAERDFRSRYLRNFWTFLASPK